MARKLKVIGWVAIAPDGNYDIIGSRAHAKENKVPEYLGECGIYDDHDPALCHVVKIEAEVEIPEIETVQANVVA